MPDPILPPTPATVSPAIVQANALAYGFDKHTDDGYWNALYVKDPDYAWKRMLGWMAGGDDVARFGLYAEPPSPWHGTVIDPPVDPPVPPSADVVLARLDLLAQQLAAQQVILVALLNRPLLGTAVNRYLGAFAITLTPTP